jgi:hypothetical protein
MKTFEESILIPKDEFYRISGKMEKKPSITKIPASEAFISFLQKKRTPVRKRQTITANNFIDNSAVNSVLSHFLIEKRPYIIKFLDVLNENPLIATWDRKDYTITIRGIHYPQTNIIEILSYLYDHDSDDFRTEDLTIRYAKHRSIPQETGRLLKAMQTILGPSRNLSRYLFISKETINDAISAFDFIAHIAEGKEGKTMARAKKRQIDRARDTEYTLNKYLKDTIEKEEYPGVKQERFFPPEYRRLRIFEDDEKEEEKEEEKADEISLPDFYQTIVDKEEFPEEEIEDDGDEEWEDEEKEAKRKYVRKKLMRRLKGKKKSLPRKIRKKNEEEEDKEWEDVEEEKKTFSLKDKKDLEYIRKKLDPKVLLEAFLEQDVKDKAEASLERKKAEASLKTPYRRSGRENIGVKPKKYSPSRK